MANTTVKDIKKEEDVIWNDNITASQAKDWSTNQKQPEEPSDWTDSNKDRKIPKGYKPINVKQLTEEECKATDWRHGNAPMPLWYIRSKSGGFKKNWYGF